ncbi:MAG: alpha-L-fucosidase [Verrucomicrobiae bacterium]|nr:alpha-L-fucosidase [Verrucomicrobiae bacterium]
MNLNNRLLPSTLTFTLMLSLAASAAKPPRDFTQETAAQREKRMAWFNEARFGMFIHWGVYAVPAGEWNGKTHYGEWFMEETKMPVSQYEKFATQFNPVQFDARAWARMAKDAGMKYLVITSKHHDGFGLWDSALTDWDIGRTPFGRDPLKELAEACKQEGIRLCFYHSIMDWHHPDWGTRRAWHDTATGEPDMDRFVEYLKGQLKELITRYGPLGILWFDGEWESPWTHERGVDLYNYVRSLQPDIIINNRVGKGRAGMQGMDKGQGVGDYGTPEQEIPATGFGPGVYWESCMTMNRHWGYNRHDQNWKSTQMLVRNLIDCASKGGNYLLNIGPTAEGLFPAPSIERLAGIGQWMKVNGDSIYGTQASPFKKLPWGRCTQKPGRRTTTLYLHVFDWPKDGQLLVPGLQNQISKAWLLSDKKRKALSVAPSEAGPIILVPTAAPDALSSTVLLQIKGAPEVVHAGLAQHPDGSILLPASEAQLHGEGIRYESGAGHDNLGYWTNPGDWAEWELKVTQPGKFEVSAEFAALQSASLTVRVGEQTVRAQVPATGSYSAFQPVKIGTLDLPMGDSIILGVRPVREGWNPVNLRAIKLQPAR